MDKAEYILTQNMILGMAKQVQILRLDDFLAAIGKADALGPVIDPSLWQAGEKNMHDIGRLAEALRGFQVAVNGLRQEATQ